MDLKLVEELIAKYYEGETTTHEEQQLKEFFSRDGVPESLKEEQIKFRFFADALHDDLRPGFEQELMETVIPAAKKITIGRPRFFRISSGIAAAIVIAFGFYFYFGTGGVTKQQTLNKQQQLAYAQAKNALLLISDRLNKGSAQVAKISKFSEAENLLTNKK